MGLIVVDVGPSSLRSILYSDAGAKLFTKQIEYSEYIEISKVHVHGKLDSLVRNYHCKDNAKEENSASLELKLSKSVSNESTNKCLDESCCARKQECVYKCLDVTVLQNYCFVNINFLSPEGPSWGNTLIATIAIDFDIVTKIGLILCIVGVALYAIFNCVKQVRSGITKPNLFNFAFILLATTFAVVVCAVGQNAIVGTTITISNDLEQNVTFSLKMEQLSFVSLLHSSLSLQDFPIMDPTPIINRGFAFAVVQEFVLIGIAVCSLCAIATCIFSTEGKTKGFLFFAILMVVLSIAQLISGIVSHLALHDLYRTLIYSDSIAMTLKLILGNSIITLVFAVLFLATSITRFIITNRKNACPSPQNTCVDNDIS